MTDQLSIFPCLICCFSTCFSVSSLTQYLQHLYYEVLIQYTNISFGVLEKLLMFFSGLLSTFLICNIADFIFCTWSLQINYFLLQIQHISPVACHYTSSLVLTRPATGTASAMLMGSEVAKQGWSVTDGEEVLYKIRSFVIIYEFIYCTLAICCQSLGCRLFSAWLWLPSMCE